MKNARKIELPMKYFGEGITIYHENVFQLTQRAKKGFVYDKNTKIYKNKSNITVGKCKYSIDIRNDSGLIYAPPTKYNSCENELKEYKWISSPFNTELMNMPKWLYKLILSGCDINLYQNNLKSFLSYLVLFSYYFVLFLYYLILLFDIIL